MISELPPVTMIGYSREKTLRASLYNLSQCHGIGQRDLYLFLDAPFQEDDCEKCEHMYGAALEMRKAFLPNLQIVRRDENLGVPGNLISAINTILGLYGRTVFFEDDVLVSHTFLEYMDASLDLYKDDERIFCVNGFKSPLLRIPRHYPHDIFLNPRNMAWGFGIWQDRWSKVDFTLKNWPDELSKELCDKLNYAGWDIIPMLNAQKAGRIHTWDVQCNYHMVKNGLYAVEPRYSLTKNIGFNCEAVHCVGRNPSFSQMRYYNFSPNLVRGVQPDKSILRLFRSSLVPQTFPERVWRKLQRICDSFSGDNLSPLNVRRN